MGFQGGCYCAAIRFKVTGDPKIKVQCHCRECQYSSGGGPSFYLLFDKECFAFIEGKPRSFTRTDLREAVTREFCENCGTQIAVHRPGLRQVIVNVGTLDEPSVFDKPEIAIYVKDRQPFHQVPDEVIAYYDRPVRKPRLKSSDVVPSRDG